jgi:hypothetical protein
LKKNIEKEIKKEKIRNKWKKEVNWVIKSEILNLYFWLEETKAFNIGSGQSTAFYYGSVGMGSYNGSQIKKKRRWVVFIYIKASLCNFFFEMLKSPINNKISNTSKFPQKHVFNFYVPWPIFVKFVLYTNFEQ